MRNGDCHAPARCGRGARAGFTLIELLVVMAVIAMLLTLAVPRYLAGVDRSKEAVLRQDLALLRETLDKYYGDKGKYPDTLEELVGAKYLRRVPVDPMTDSDATWVTLPPQQADMGGVGDIRSGASGVGRDGTEYRSW